MLGETVIVRRTENVVQRAPRVIGMSKEHKIFESLFHCTQTSSSEGIIQSVPAHPNTWFKVRFPEIGNQVLTFRPSALQLASEIAENPKP